jgi:HD containing hydrolase-like enzyme
MMKSEFRALDDENWDVETIVRMQGIRRWHMIPMLREQTLAEHSFNVAALHYVIRMRIDPSGNYTHPMAGAALFHDIEEAFTGDIPTPTKKFLNGHAELREMTLHPIFDFQEGDAFEQSLLKLCDLADGIRHVNKFGIGRTAIHAGAGLREQYGKVLDRIRKVTVDETYWKIVNVVEKYIEA